MPAGDEMPSTIQRSGHKAQRTWSKAHDSAIESYGEAEAISKANERATARARDRSSR